MDEIATKEKSVGINGEGESGSKKKGRLFATHGEFYLTDAQSDQSSPLFSAKTFEELGLKEELIRMINSKNYKRPSKIQEFALPILIGSSDTHFVGQSQAGTGKTAAFGLAILQNLNVQLKALQYLILCPTIELAKQVYDVMRELGGNMSATITLVTRGVKTIPNVPHIIVATPGRLLYFIKTNILSLEKLDMLVIDEADKMVSDLDSLWDTVESILKYRPAKCRMCLFSATYAAHIREKVQKLVPEKPKRIVLLLENTELLANNIQEYCFVLKNPEQRLDALKKILDNFESGSVMIFVNRRSDADRIGGMLTSDGYSVIVLHGGPNVTPEERDAKLQDFIKFKARFLIATDLVSRGIDVVTVNLVINYDFPLLPNSSLPDFETYVHRMGRTGRFGRQGSVVSFIYDRTSQIALKFVNKELGMGSDSFRRKIKVIDFDYFNSFDSEENQ